MTINSCDELPNGLLEERGNFTLAVDIMNINSITFMMTTSRAIHFRTAEMLKNEKMTLIMTSLKQIINTYHGRGFKTQHILADGQFESTRKHIKPMGIMLNITGRDEHVPEIEHYIRTVNKRVCAIIRTLPFQNYPQQLLVETVYNVVFWLNCFPHKNRIHATLSPRAIVTGSHIDYKKLPPKIWIIHPSA